MTNTTTTNAPKMSKMHAGIKVALEMIANGDYIVDRENGHLFNKQLKQVGSLDKKSGNVFYVIRGVDILAHRLLYCYYNGGTINALVEDMVIKHLDGDKANNAEGNIVQVPRKGAKQALEALLAGKTVEVSVARAEELEATTPETFKLVQPMETYVVPAPTATEEEPTQAEPKVLQYELLTAEQTAEEQATALLQAGELSIKEVAEATGLKYKKVWGMKKKMGL